MRHKIRHLLLIFILCSVAIVTGNAHSAQGQDMQASEAWQVVKSGNAVVLMRHALAPGMGDPPEFDLDRCLTQRNLSDAGRVQAKAIGDVLRANGIEDATILTSQWCRCSETALLLNLGKPKPTSMLNSFFQNRGSEHDQTRTLNESLDEWLSLKDDVRVLVTHQVNINSLTGHYAGSGDMLIVTMDDGNPVVLAKISTN